MWKNQKENFTLQLQITISLKNGLYTWNLLKLRLFMMISSINLVGFSSLLDFISISIQRLEIS